MERKILVGKIIDFCYRYDVLDDSSIEISELKNIIEKRLDEAHFVESLINTIILRTKKYSGIDIERVIELLTELEKRRLEIEYKSPVYWRK